MLVVKVCLSRTTLAQLPAVVRVRACEGAAEIGTRGTCSSISLFKLFSYNLIFFPYLHEIVQVEVRSGYCF